ncbi:hypothetical protein VB780_28110 [Leptolyngbya sp. CCNP1308]|uniref:hypothetical protein n=1 Tax=Leptolyngbya sp. CCNP1308 TaxID=3110255 RepID=UPI002B1F37F4|nr:hypothetical protein [Leptolyngbya sp. CCNP1308]MEA5452471.1 hypothetical protein [Leptolyngbya sp. CCNP1308]
MKIYAISLAGNIYWRIHPNNPPMLRLKSLPGLFLINPLIYSEIELACRNFIFKKVAIINSTVIISTGGFIFGTLLEEFDPTSLSIPVEKAKIFRIGSEGKTGSDIFDVLPTYVEYFSSSLRQASKQVTIPTSFSVIAKGELIELPELNFTEAKTLEVSIPRYTLETAVTWNNLVDADLDFLISKNFVYERLLLDAIHAYKDKDYRRSLLYTAISVETLAATKLDEAYDLIIQNGDIDNVLRLVSLSRKGGILITKDPVYELLRSRSKFLELLHEISLYVFGKSLLVDNEVLYQKASKLYKTRNKIAHLGEPHAGNQTTFAMSEEDALEAIECAISIFQWFEVSTQFPIPRLSFVNGYSPL